MYYFRVITIISSLILASCVSHKLVDARDIIKYESDSSFHHLFYMGSDEDFHYIFRRDKVSFEYKIPKGQAEFAFEFPHQSKTHEPILLVPGTLIKAINKVSEIR